MRCAGCRGHIVSGVEAKKMIVEYIQHDNTVKIFGFLAPDGPLNTATGRLHRGWHSKCYHVARKRAAKGDAVTGRLLGPLPNAYDIDDLVLTADDLAELGITVEEARARSTAAFSTRLTELRAVAARIGKGVGDATVLEAYWAQQHGGPYEHKHAMRLESYQLRAHLLYAHNIENPGADLHYEHNLRHAIAVQGTVIVGRRADPGHRPPQERDWRTQHTAEITDLPDIHVHGGHA